MAGTQGGFGSVCSLSLSGSPDVHMHCAQLGQLSKHESNPSNIHKTASGFVSTAICFTLMAADRTQNHLVDALVFELTSARQIFGPVGYRQKSCNFQIPNARGYFFIDFSFTS